MCCKHMHAFALKKNQSTFEATSATPRAELLHWVLGISQVSPYPRRHRVLVVRRVL